MARQEEEEQEKEEEEEEEEEEESREDFAREMAGRRGHGAARANLGQHPEANPQCAANTWASARAGRVN